MEARARIELPPPPDGFEETGRQILGGDDFPSEQLDPRTFRLPAGSYTPFARGIMNAVSMQGQPRKPVPMRVGEGAIDLNPPATRVPRNQRQFLQIGAFAKAKPAAKAKSEEATLDGFLLLDACDVEDPDDAVQAVLEGCGITRCVTEDLTFFTRLTHLDVGDNRLQLEKLAGLPNLQELHIDCNGIASIDLPAGGFPRLEVLNLSYNGLTLASIMLLAQLACLRDLDLTGNRLSRLPPDWSEFLELRKLTLDKNLLADEALVALGSTPYLQELSLEDNRIERIPHAAVENGGFGEVSRLSLAQNLVQHEDALVPVLQMPLLKHLSVWGNPFVRSRVPQAFEGVLNDRGMALTLEKPQPPPKAPAYDANAVLDLDAVVHSHRPAELAMRSAARQPHVEPPPRENVHIAQARANLAAESARHVSEVGSGGFFVTQAGDVRTTGPAHTGGGGGGARRGGPAETGGGRSGGLKLSELQDALLISDEAESLIDSSIDVRTAINALKYALEHPLVEYYGSRPTHHLSSTTAFEASRRTKFVRTRDPLNVAFADDHAPSATRAGAGRGAADAAALPSQLARQAALERGIDSVPAKLDALKRTLKVAELSANTKTPTMSKQGVSSLQSMLSALQAHEGSTGGED